ncbi:MAG: SRPBCC family protein [Acidimicrobiales bacterium]
MSAYGLPARKFGESNHVTITEDIYIDCQPATVFDILSDVRNETAWNDDVSKADLLTGEPVGQGSQFLTVHGRPLGDITSTITTFDRPGRLEFGATTKLMDLTVAFTFSESGSGTDVHGTFEPQPKGIMKLLFPLLRPLIRRNMAKQHQNMKAFCEAQAP